MMEVGKKGSSLIDVEYEASSASRIIKLDTRSVGFSEMRKAQNRSGSAIVVLILTMKQT